MKTLTHYAACVAVTFIGMISLVPNPPDMPAFVAASCVMALFLFVPWMLVQGIAGALSAGRSPAVAHASASPGAQPATSWLERPLCHWTKRDPFTLRELLQSVAIFGKTGSGKSSGSGMMLARAITRLPRSGGLILVSKPEDRAFWVQRFREAGRLADLVIFGPREPARCNFIEFEMQQGGDTRALVDFLMVTGEALTKGTHEGKNQAFWEQAKKRLLYNAIEPIRQAWGKITIPDIHEFITTAAYDVGTIKDNNRFAAWKRGYHFKTMDAASQKQKTSIEAHDFNMIGTYWAKRFIGMDPEQRSSIIEDVTNVLHTYNAGIAREMVSTTSTITPAAMAQGKWVLVDFPLDVYSESGKIIMHGWKYITQKSILRRHTNQNDAVIVIHADEAQEMVSSFDASFLAKCRSHLGCMIYLTQSIHSYLGGMKEGGEHAAKAFLTNFGTQVFHTLGDAQSAEYASSLLGKRRETFISTQPRQEASAGEMLFGHVPAGGSLSEQYQPVLQPAVFLSGLRSGGRNKVVDGIVVRPGDGFANGQNWLRVEFSQE
jgi:hypothetical protein